MPEPKKITREEANEIIQTHLNGPMEKVVICYKGWWDIRGLTKKELDKFILKLLHKTEDYNLGNKNL